MIMWSGLQVPENKILYSISILLRLLKSNQSPSVNDNTMTRIVTNYGKRSMTTNSQRN
jgi:hypothetical protein